MIEQISEKRAEVRYPRECHLDIVRITGSHFEIKGMLVDYCAQGASFLSPVGLHTGEIVTIRHRTRLNSSSNGAHLPNAAPPFQMVTCEVIYCDMPYAEGQLRYKVGVKHLLTYF